jgi:hypothetical protein
LYAEERGPMGIRDPARDLVGDAVPCAQPAEMDYVELISTKGTHTRD